MPIKKSYLIVVAVVIILLILLGVGYWYWQSKKGDVEVNDEVANQETLPPFSVNPLENKPNINPADQTNPFKNIKTNPFE